MSHDDDQELRAQLYAHVDRLIAEAKRSAEAKDGMRRLDERIRVEVLALGEQVVRVAARSRAARVKRTKETPACEECDEPTVFKQLRDCRVRTCLTGEPVEADSAYAVCRRCAKGVVDLHHAMGAGADGFSERLREMAVLAGAADPFEHAADLLLQNLAGVHIGKTKVHGLWPLIRALTVVPGAPSRWRPCSLATLTPQHGAGDASQLDHARSR